MWLRGLLGSGAGGAPHAHTRLHYPRSERGRNLGSCAGAALWDPNSWLFTAASSLHVQAALHPRLHPADPKPGEWLWEPDSQAILGAPGGSWEVEGLGSAFGGPGSPGQWPLHPEKADHPSPARTLTELGGAAGPDCSFSVPPAQTCSSCQTPPGAEAQAGERPGHSGAPSCAVPSLGHRAAPHIPARTYRTGQLWVGGGQGCCEGLGTPLGL